MTQLTNNIIMEWDSKNWSRALPFWLSKSKLQLKQSKCLEIGARNGGLTLWLADQFKSVTYSDVTEQTQQCIALHAKYNKSNIEYKILDATKTITLPKRDVVITKSVLGVGEQDNTQKIIDNVFEYLESGGEYWFVENLSGSCMHQVLRKHCTSWGHRWSYIKCSEIEQKFSKFADLEFITFGFLGAFGRGNMQRNFLGTLDTFFFDKVVPKDMHYIVAGVARKK